MAREVRGFGEPAPTRPSSRFDRAAVLVFGLFVIVGVGYLKRFRPSELQRGRIESAGPVHIGAVVNSQNGDPVVVIVDLVDDAVGATAS